MKRESIIILSCIAGLSISCKKTQFDEVERTNGDADFTRYVAVGNSLTQGFQDGGVHNEKGQQDNSYPAILARQMAKVQPNMGEFVQPTVPGNGAGFLELEVNAEGELEAVDIPEDPNWENWGDPEVSYNNLGISGIAVWNCYARSNNEGIINHALLGGVTLLGGGPLNPYAKFLDFGEDPLNIFSQDPTFSYVDKIRESEATFFTCWLGNNDVLGWALAGGNEQETNIPLIGSLKLSPLTPVDEFTEKYDSCLAAFAASDAQGVCATLPDVTSIPMFTTVNEEYLGVDELWITDNSGTVRLKTEEDLILLYALDAIDAGAGSSQSNPIGEDVVLDFEEKEMAQTRSNELNNVIYGLANKYGFGVVDMHGYLEGFKSGFNEDGVDLSARFVEGGVFSLDGVHPNQKGYAIIADKFIDAINLKYGANIPNVEINNYTGIYFPN